MGRILIKVIHSKEAAQHNHLDIPKVWGTSKVIHTKYSKHYLYTVAHTIDCVCSKIDHGLTLNDAGFLEVFFSEK